MKVLTKRLCRSVSVLSISTLLVVGASGSPLKPTLDSNIFDPSDPIHCKTPFSRAFQARVLYS